MLCLPSPTLVMVVVLNGHVRIISICLVSFTVNFWYFSNGEGVVSYICKLLLYLKWTFWGKNAPFIQCYNMMFYTGGMGSGSSFMSRTPEEFLSNVSEMEAQDGSKSLLHTSFYFTVLFSNIQTQSLFSCWILWPQMIECSVTYLLVVSLSVCCWVSLYVYLAVNFGSAFNFPSLQPTMFILGMHIPWSSTFIWHLHWPPCGLELWPWRTLRVGVRHNVWQT